MPKVVIYPDRPSTRIDPERIEIQTNVRGWVAVTVGTRPKPTNMRERVPRRSAHRRGLVASSFDPKKTFGRRWVVATGWQRLREVAVPSERLGLRDFSAGLLASSLHPALIEVKRLEEKTAERGWDDEDADPIPRVLWKRARTLWREVKRVLPELPTPLFSPSADGTIFVSWTVSKTREVLVEVGHDRMKWSLRDVDGGFCHGPCSSVSEALEILTRLS